MMSHSHRSATSPLGRLASVTAARINGVDQPDPADVHRYDAAGHILTTLAEGPTTFYTYDIDGNLQQTLLPNGVTEDYDYDVFNRLVRETVTRDDPATPAVVEAIPVATFDYNFEDTQYPTTDRRRTRLMLESDGQRGGVRETRYDLNGTVFSVTAIDYTYDDENRLTSETRDEGNDGIQNGGDYTDTFTLDLVGNRKTLVHDAVGTASDETIAYAYNERDQLTAEDSTINAHDKSYAYDEYGSMTGKGSDTYTWDLRGRMVTATVGGTTSTIGYDSAGQRISEQTGTDPTTYYINDKSNPTGYPQIIEERSGTTPANATFVRSYTIGLRVEGQADLVASTVNVTFYLIDGHGSTRSVTDSTGHEFQRYDYRAFGESQYCAKYEAGTWTALAADGVYTIHLFAGDGERDQALGLDYHDARWRDGFHFVSFDPAQNSYADPQSLHKYLYCEANAINTVDPSGLFGVLDVLCATSTQSMLANMQGFSGQLAMQSAAERRFSWTFVGLSVLAMIAPTVLSKMADIVGPIASNVLSTLGRALRSEESAAMATLLRYGGGIGRGAANVVVRFGRGIRVINNAANTDIGADLLNVISESASTIEIEAREVTRRQVVGEAGLSSWVWKSAAEKLTQINKLSQIGGKTINYVKKEIWLVMQKVSPETASEVLMANESSWESEAAQGMLAREKVTVVAIDDKTGSILAARAFGGN